MSVYVSSYTTFLAISWIYVIRSLTHSVYINIGVYIPKEQLSGTYGYNLV